MKKTIIRIVLVLIALTMILPADSFHLPTGHDAENKSTVLLPSASMPASEIATANDGKNVYRAWVDGEPHFTKLYFQTSKDEGRTWSDSKSITDETYTPISVELLKDKKAVHLIWEDGTCRAFATYYMKSNDGGATWSKPVNVGFDNPKMVLDNNVIYILSTTPDRRMVVSRSADRGNTFTRTEPDTGLSSFANDIIVNDGIHIAFSGGIREPETGIHKNMGIYCIFSKDGGIHWDNAVKVSDVKAPVNSVSIKNDNNLLYVEWTEDREREHLTYMKTSLNGVSWDKEETVKRIEIPQPKHNPAVSSRTKSAEKEWTFIVYLDADNNLYNYGKEDLNEMEMIGSNANINIVVLMDLNANGDTKAYYVEKDADTATITSPEIPLTNINSSWGTELNMGNPQTCIDFVKYVYNNYPAKKYAMDFWNHGGSWKYGMCSDDTNSDDLTMLEVRTIFETLRAQTGRRILWDVCGYDECLMSDVSVDYDEKPYINYILNSEDSIGGDGWEYNIVLGHLNDSPTMCPEYFAYWIYWSYGELYGWSGSLTTMSVINSTEFDYVLMPAINNLGQKLRHKALSLNSNIKTAASNSASWQDYTHQRDLIDFCQKLQAQIPAATDPEIYNAAQKIIDIGAANTFGDVPWNSTWNHSKPILCHNQNTGENGVTIYCTETTYDTTYDTLRIAPETRWDDAVKAVIANTADYPNEEPACSISSPSEGSYVVLNTIATISGTANDNADAGTVQKVEVKIDREAWQTATGTTSWSFGWDTTGWTLGPHKIFARAYDGTDYSETWVCVNVELIVDPTLPDLVITNQNITFSNPSPSEGETVTINVTVWNINSNESAQNASYVEVGFYVGNPAAGGELIGIVDTEPRNITPNSCAYAEIIWDTSGSAGWHNIYVVADPNHTVPELTDNNNTAIKTIPVAGYAVDASCSDNSSTVQAGASTNYEIVVANKGTYTDSFNLTIDNPTSWNANFNDNPPAKGVKGDKAARAEYHNYTTATNELQNIAANYPSITKLYSIGKSWENREIWAMKVSDNVAVNETDEPDVLYMGMHHAREWMSVEVPIYFLKYLVNNYGTDSKVTYLVDNRELWIVPMLNPDGYEYSRHNDSMWRKNRRNNGDGTYGVDPNRNYNGSQNGDPNGAWGGAGASHTTSADTYCGPSPFSEPETQAIRDLVIAHAGNGNRFILSVSYHSYAQEIYYPWGYATSSTLNTPDWQLQRRIAENLSAYSGYTVMQSGDSYLTTGDTDDWVYGYSKYVLGSPTYPFTIELDTSFQPPTSQIPITCEKHIGVNLYLAEVADNPSQEYPKITHTPLPDTKNITGPYHVIAAITSNIGLNSSTLKLVWKTSTVSDTTVSLTATGNPNEYYADIPGQPDGTWVYYYIYAEDSGGNKSISPETKPWESQKTHRFYIGQDKVTYTVYNLAPNATKTVNLTVTSPSTALPEETANIKVVVTSQNNSLKKDSVTTTTTVMPGILLADDTNGGNITGFKSALDANGYHYDTKIAEGSTGFSGVLSKYPVVLWVCKGTTTLSDVDKQNLRFYLEGWGNLFISGEDIGYDIADDADGFYQNYLHAKYIADNSSINNLTGMAGDPIGDGFNNIPITGSYPEEIAPYDANGSVVFRYTGSSKNATIKVDTGVYRVVYFGCMYFEGADAQANKNTIMDRIIKWLRGAPKILHTPLKDTEDTAGPYKVIATITDDNLNTSSLEVRYSTNGGASYNSLGMGSTGGANEYCADIPGQPDGTTVYYYIRASDLDGNLGVSPNGASEAAPSTLHSFWVGPDTTPPTIMHTPLSNTSGSGPYAVTATITDNLALNTSKLFVYYNTSKSAGYTQLAMGSAGGNDYSASIPSQALGVTINYYIEATDSANNPNTATHPGSGRHSFTIVLMPSILLVDDDGTDTWETYYQNALTGSGYEYTMGTGASSLSGYDIVIWFADDTSFLSTDEQTKLTTYLDNGGCLYISAEELGYSHGSTTLYTNYLKCTYGGDNAGADAQTVNGVTGDPITGGMSVPIGGSGGAANNQYPDYFTTTGTVIFKLSTYNVGMRYDSGAYKVVYTSFNFESINSASDRAALMDKIIKWFNPTYANDVGPWSIDTLSNSGSYSAGAYDINATVINYGTDSQTGFKVSCEVKERGLGYTTMAFEDNTESGVGGWTHVDLGTGGDLWHLVNTYGHINASSWFWGNDNAGYNNNSDNALVSQNIDLTGMTGNIFLSFWTDYDLEGSTFDNLYVEVYDGTWTEVDHYPQSTGDVSGGWVYKEYDISAYEGKIIQVRFRAKTDGSINYGDGTLDPPEGVFIDDIKIWNEIPFTETVVYGPNNLTVPATLAQYDTYKLSWNYNFDNTSAYKITIRTWLGTDQKTSNNVKTININTVYQINLNTGWNFVTLPYINSPYTAEDLANDVGNKCTHVSEWNKTLQKFVVHRKGSAENNFEIKPGIGYHAYVTGSCAFNITGTRVATVSINLDAGWNSIGWKNDTSTTAENLCQSISNCTAIAYWNSTLGRYVTYIAGSNISDFKIEKGMACFVYVTSASVWKNE